MWVWILSGPGVSPKINRWAPRCFMSGEPAVGPGSSRFDFPDAASPRALDPGHPGMSARRAAPELQMLLDLKVLGMRL